MACLISNPWVVAEEMVFFGLVSTCLSSIKEKIIFCHVEFVTPNFFHTKKSLNNKNNFLWFFIYGDDWNYGNLFFTFIILFNKEKYCKNWGFHRFIRLTQVLPEFKMEIYDEMPITFWVTCIIHVKVGSIVKI